MSKDYSKNNFQMLLASYNEARESNPRKVEKDAYYSLLDMGLIESTGLEKLKSKLFGICATICGLIVLLSIFTIGPESTIGIAGFAFFLAGYFVGTQQDGLVAIYAHGLIGFCLMNGYAAYTVFNSALLLPRLRILLFLVLGIAIIIQLIGLIYAAIYNYSDNLKTNKFNKNVPILLATISTIIISVTASIITKL